MKVSAIQMNSSDSVSDNLDLLDSLFAEASQQDSNLVLLPENFAFMGHPKKLVEEVMEDFNDGPIQSFVIDKAKEYGVWVVAGSIPIKNHDQSKSLARCLIVDASGTLVSYYDKIHLFDVIVNGKTYSLSLIHI